MKAYKHGGLIAHGLAFGLLVTAPLQAAVFNVDTIVDDPTLTACDDATPNDCSLRGAIIKANGLAEAVTINVPAGTYILSQATPCFFRGNAIGKAHAKLGFDAGQQFDSFQTAKTQIAVKMRACA